MKTVLSILIVALIAATWVAGAWGEAEWQLSVGEAAPRAVVFAPEGAPRPTARRPGEPESTLIPALRGGVATVRLPEPRQFHINDLVQIVVNESAQSDSTARLDTRKTAELDAAIEAFIDIGQLLELRVEPTALSRGRPEIRTEMGNRFAGSGNYSRRDTMSTRIQARIIDIKPNGNLVLEASKHIRSDRESVSIVLTGICRAADVTADNTVLSNQLHDLRVIKEHDGALQTVETLQGCISRLIESAEELLKSGHHYRGHPLLSQK